ncbi:putative 2-hydroxyacid dehydrogenase [Geobacter sp. OR-1]|uniref:D-2-hydroxyacid dehydrogenase n=1 Tax=Geobacter sp. OR-1 TaxID=1266765 RepID=UPI0005423326|nr:D-2-hydroxyacid dehydrogenase [Geobacter sp. OR-1]GAM10350.1 putative 2-hydroxyacid dehydrogenase [Geobacter sp. OR-1]
MRLTVLDGYTVNPGDNPWSSLEALADCRIYDRTSADLLLERCCDTEIILTNKVKLTEEIITALPKLRFIAVLATGYNNVDVEAAARRGIPVSNIPAYSTESVAQTAFALLLELVTGAGLHNAAVKAGEWVSCPDYSFSKMPIVELYGLTIGIVGYGNIGRAVARIASAFGMKVIAYSPRTPSDPGPVPVTFMPLEQLFSNADVVCLNCPQTPENTGFVNASLIAGMKPTSYFINVARGGLVNEADLADALNRGVIAGAGLDVVTVEPMVADNPLLTAANCVMTPHIAWASLAARKRMMKTVTSNVAAFLAGAPINVVNSP